MKTEERKRNSQAIAFGLGEENSDFHIEESYSPRALVRYPLFVKVLGCWKSLKKCGANSPYIIRKKKSSMEDPRGINGQSVMTIETAQM
ncbi:hypothetical protein MJG53_009508 [Ovis ammon polii x Ovis aries]|uniref:Uncharacterized protein n=2 Tax=Ovis TaxID=9935 RepID=A0A836A9M7_SHEEP|nr:hypothetical protein JEQ12_019366 [Ovis aries]KAI4565833.1 hypothetical protein MJT46_009208 [Ovis ammon polii x Ovis aries]KAI4581983.1 hypothetical protein MJG53_009508 [Ovis ammon polii x Ovis aries]